MKVAIIQFPGSNCDWDAEHSVQNVIGLPAGRVWHKDPLPEGVEAVIVPVVFLSGIICAAERLPGFLRSCPTYRALRLKGGQVLGICNGFQILCEAGLFPGALGPK